MEWWVSHTLLTVFAALVIFVVVSVLWWLWREGQTILKLTLVYLFLLSILFALLTEVHPKPKNTRPQKMVPVVSHEQPYPYRYGR